MKTDLDQQKEKIGKILKLEHSLDQAKDKVIFINPWIKLNMIFINPCIKLNMIFINPCIKLNMIFMKPWIKLNMIFINPWIKLNMIFIFLIINLFNWIVLLSLLKLGGKNNQNSQELFST